MNTHAKTPFLHLTSVGTGSQPPSGEPTPAALGRALWQQRCSLFGAYSRADYLRHTADQHAQQVALAEELQRLANEAFNLAEELESVRT